MSIVRNSSTESDPWISRSSNEKVLLVPGTTADFEDPANFSTVKFLTFIASILIVLKLTEKWMSTRDKGFSFVRPAFLVNSGLNFGINGCGALIVIVATEGGKQLFQCIDPSSMNLSSIVMRYLLFLYLGTIVYELALLILPILQKQRVSNITIMQHLLWIALAVTALKHQPVGFIIMVPVVHCLSRVLFYMLTVMETASQELKPNNKWSNRLLWSTFGLLTLLLAHQSYFYMAHKSGCEPGWIRPVVNGIILIQLAASVMNLVTSSTYIATYSTESNRKPMKAD